MIRQFHVRNFCQKNDSMKRTSCRCPLQQSPSVLVSRTVSCTGRQHPGLLPGPGQIRWSIYFFFSCQTIGCQATTKGLVLKTQCNWWAASAHLQFGSRLFECMGHCWDVVIGIPHWFYSKSFVYLEKLPRNVWRTAPYLFLTLTYIYLKSLMPFQWAVIETSFNLYKIL